MTAQSTASPAAPSRGGGPGPGGWAAAVRGWVSRRSLAGLAWTGSFVVLAAMLVARNAYLFTTRIYEEGDYGANTIAVLQAKHFTLLTGNYSKEGFDHPGPAFLYVMAGGEALFHDLLHLVPTPWNGQLLAILLLNAALLAACVSIIARLAGTAAGALAGLAVVLLVIVVHPLAANSGWMPYVYVAPVLLLLVSAASVAAGRTADLPLLALAALLCVNGQAEFLLFAPVTVVVALAGLVMTRRRQPARSPVPPWHWAVALAIAVVLALPILVNTLVHWPGVFGSYFSYMKAIRGVHTTHSLSTSIKYTLRFWWPGTPDGASAARSLLVAGVAGVAALVLALLCPRPELRRFLLWSVGMVILTTVLFVGYTFKAVDDNEITAYYLGYFYWAAPALAVLTGVTGAVAWVGWRPAAGWRPVAVLAPFAAAAVAAAVIAGVTPLRPDTPGGPAQYFGLPVIPHDVQVLSGLARGRMIVLQLDDNDWASPAGLIAYADRTRVPMCIAGSNWTFLFRAQSICTPDQVRSGMRFVVSSVNGRTAPPPGTRLVISSLPNTWITTRQPVGQ